MAGFNAGDVWYFPHGFGHSIQGIGAEHCLFVLVFDMAISGSSARSALAIGSGTRPIFWRAGRDVGYVPQGYGHYIENIGNDDLELNNGTYDSISLADWIGANPHLLLATNLEVPEDTFKDFKTRNRFLAG